MDAEILKVLTALAGPGAVGAWVVVEIVKARGRPDDKPTPKAHEKLDAIRS